MTPAGELLEQVNVAGVAANVKDELESLDVEDIFDKSSARRDGYVDPGEAAFQMFEEAPEEYFGQVADAWKNIYHGKPPLSKLEGFVKEHCPDYAQWFTRHLRFRTR